MHSPQEDRPMENRDNLRERCEGLEPRTAPFMRDTRLGSENETYKIR